eukprot:3578344-Pyramimonas_sp.AAC.1
MASWLSLRPATSWPNEAAAKRPCCRSYACPHPALRMAPSLLILFLLVPILALATLSFLHLRWGGRLLRSRSR